LFEYSGGTPFHLYLTLCFKENKNWGSKDLKRYRSACYYFWRNAFGVSRQSPDHILHWLQTHFTTAVGDLPTTNEPASIHPASNHQSQTPPSPTAAVTVHQSTNQESIPNYPYLSFAKQLSQNITPDILSHWFVTEPFVWLSNGNISLESLKSQLTKSGITLEECRGNAIAVSAQVNLNPWIENGNAYIQDISSQTAMEWSDQPMSTFCHANSAVWDCCAGAGGKSIALLKQFPNTNLTCSDIRSNILENLKNRFQLLGLKKPNVFVIPPFFSASENNFIENKHWTSQNSTFDVIVADVPCSGSGTWRRNPENIHFFDVESITTFADKQRNIVHNVSPSLAIGGYLVYLTCSLFAAENENNVKEILRQNPKLHLVSEKFCGGTEIQGDYIYRAVLQKLH
jgi:16S rRNA (cytosine967-C5)-methyltransferase